MATCPARRSRTPANLRGVPTTMPYTPILATLGYVLSPDGNEVLLVHRNCRPGDAHLGKYNGLGGKLHADEDIVAGMKREIATLRPVDVERPPDAATDRHGGAAVARELGMKGLAERLEGGSG